MLQPTLVALGTAFFVALFMTPVVRRLAFRVGAVARPVARSVHTKPMPMMGGVAIYLAFAAGTLLTSSWREPAVQGILFGGALVLALGLLDDFIELSAKVKFLGQVAIALLVVNLFPVYMEFMTNPFTGQMIFFDWGGIQWGKLFTVIWIVSFVNVINLVDGLDGLAAGISTIGALTLMFVALGQEQSQGVAMTAALAGAATGFLRYNFNPAKIFMGDCGAMFLGFALATVSVHGVLKQAAAISLVVPMVALGLPILDTAFAIVRRLANGRTIGEADKDHIHHRLLRLGLSHRSTVLVMWGVSAWLGLSALILSGLPLGQAIPVLALVLMALAFAGYWLGLFGLRQHERTSAKQ